MAIRPHELDSIAPVIATFKIAQTSSVDDLKDSDIGLAVTISGNSTVTKGGDGDVVLGKLIALTLTDADDGDRVASVQVGGICRLPIATTYPTVGDRVVGAANGEVKQAPALAGDDPAGGNIARGTTLDVNGTTDCLILLN
jgi:predicted RecA/RadA family phage recombinase